MSKKKFGSFTNSINAYFQSLICLPRYEHFLASIFYKVSLALLNKIQPILESRKQQCMGSRGQVSNNVVNMIKITKDKALRIISFKDRTQPSDALNANHNFFFIEQLSVYL